MSRALHHECANITSTPAFNNVTTYTYKMVIMLCQHTETSGSNRDPDIAPRRCQVDGLKNPSSFKEQSRLTRAFSAAVM